MIRFVDIREAETGERFAFFDTVRDQFVELNGEQAWTTWDEFGIAYELDARANGYVVERLKERYQRLCPEWAFESEAPFVVNQQGRVGGISPLAMQIEPVVIDPPAFECGRCAWLHTHEGEEVPEHSPRCPMREERAVAWNQGWHAGAGGESKHDNPHR